MIDCSHPALSIDRQTKLLGISRSSVYYTPITNAEDSRIMHWIDKIFTDCPFYGSRRIGYELKKRFGIEVNRKRVKRLMRLMGLEAIYPKHKPQTSNSNPEHKKYPYLLNNVVARYPNHIWGTDITYVRLESGFCYLVAMLDWFSRYVVEWQLSPSLEIDFCIENLQHALTMNKPAIHNSDQGSHFTSPRYTDLLTYHDVQISMDGRGRCMDNIFTERLWRTIKYENIFLKSYRDIREAREGLTEYFAFYNHTRPHQSLEYHTPAEVYFDKS